MKPMPCTCGEEIIFVTNYSDGSWVVSCGKCKRHTSAHPTEEEAIKAWNYYQQLAIDISGCEAYNQSRSHDSDLERGNS